MKVKVGAIQPRVIWGAEEWRNAADAVRLANEAADNGAVLITFPEGYPGPSHGPMDSAGKLDQTPIEMLQDVAAKREIYIVASNLEPHETEPEGFYLTQKLIGPDGSILGNYKRCQPDTPCLNEYLHGGRKHILPGEGPMVIDTPLGKIGLLICSELFVPELARIEMLMGAEIIIAPMNGQHSPTRPRLTDTWRCVARARAAENQCYVIVVQNLFREGIKGVGIIAGPEDTVAQSTDPGILYGELDMERLRWWRSVYYGPEFFVPPDEEHPVTRCRPGQIWERKPDLYHMLVEPDPGAFNYDYWETDLDSWHEQPPAPDRESAAKF